MGATRVSSVRSAAAPQVAGDGAGTTGKEGDRFPKGAVEKAAVVLDSFPPGRTPIGVTELARRCGLAKSTTHRTLKVLEAIGMVERAESGYRLGVRLRQLAEISVGRSPSRLRDSVLPYLLELYEETHLTVHLGMWSGEAVLVIENLHGRRGNRIPPLVGTEAPLHCTALGKLLLAYADDHTRRRVAQGEFRAFTRETIVSQKMLDAELESIRSEGIAFSCGEFLPGVVQVAAPLRGASESVSAAISVSGRRGDVDIADAARRVRRIAYAAAASSSFFARTAVTPRDEGCHPLTGLRRERGHGTLLPTGERLRGSAR